MYLQISSFVVLREREGLLPESNFFDPYFLVLLLSLIVFCVIWNILLLLLLLYSDVH